MNCTRAWLVVLLSALPWAMGADATALRGKALDELRKGLTSNEFWPSMHAAEGLSRAGFGAEVVATLTPRLTTETDHQHRCGLARELVRAGQEQHVAVLAAILRDEKSNGRVHASESLFKVSRVGDREALTRAMDATEPALAIMAAAALGRQGDEEALRRLRAALGDGEAKTRELAAWVLGQIGVPADAAPIRKLAEAEPEAVPKSFYWNAAARLGDTGAMAIVTGNLTATDGEVRTYAAEALVACGTADQLPRLEALLSDPVLDAPIRAADAVLCILSRQAR